MSILYTIIMYRPTTVQKIVGIQAAAWLFCNIKDKIKPTDMVNVIHWNKAHSYHYVK